jgi:hypothetical protein
VSLFFEEFVWSGEGGSRTRGCLADTVIYKITGLASCPTSPRKNWRARRDSNPRPADYGSAALRWSVSARESEHRTRVPKAPLSYGRAGTKTRITLTVGSCSFRMGIRDSNPKRSFGAITRLEPGFFAFYGPMPSCFGWTATCKITKLPLVSEGRCYALRLSAQPKQLRKTLPDF